MKRFTRLFLAIALFLIAFAYSFTTVFAATSASNQSVNVSSNQDFSSMNLTVESSKLYLYMIGQKEFPVLINPWDQDVELVFTSSNPTYSYLTLQAGSVKRSFAVYHDTDLTFLISQVAQEEWLIVVSYDFGTPLYSIIVETEGAQVYLSTENHQDNAPVFSGQTAFVTNVDNPLSTSSILSNITAIDETDGNVTHLIQVDGDNYTANRFTKGSYTVELSVSDSSGNIAYLTVHVVVVDAVAPTFGITSGSQTQVVSYKQTFNVESFKSQLLVSDNYDYVNDIAITVASNTYTANRTVPGSYQIVYRATDTSNNSSNIAITINVIDDVAPVFSGPSVITKPSTSQLTVSQIISQFTVNDEINGNVTASIVVISDEYTGKGNQVGNWEIVLQASDASGNIVLHTVTIVVEDNLPPVFYVKDGFFITVEQSVSLTNEQIINILQVTGQLTLHGTYQITTLVNEYIGNEITPGIYAISYKYVDSLGNESIHNVAIQVLDTSDEDVIGGEVDDRSWFEKTVVQPVKDFAVDIAWPFVQDNFWYAVAGLIVLIGLGFLLVAASKKSKW